MVCSLLKTLEAFYIFTRSRFRVSQDDRIQMHRALNSLLVNVIYIISM